MYKKSNILILSLIAFSLCLSIFFNSMDLPTVYADTINSGINMFTDGIDISLGVTGSYQDIDLSSYIPSGSTGVIIDAFNLDASDQSFFIRKDGSTDDYYADLMINQHSIVWVGVDADREIEAKIEHTNIDFYLMGYTGDAVTFFDNGIDYSTATIGSFVDVDASGDIPEGATGVIYFGISAGTFDMAVRHPDSTDDFYQRNRDDGTYGLCGVNSSRMFQQKIESTLVDLYVMGYTENQITFNINWDDCSIVTPTSWEDIDITAHTSADATTGIIFMDNTATGYYDGSIRAEGSTDARGLDSAIDTYGCLTGGVELDSGQIFEGWISSTNLDFYVIGYSEYIEEENLVFPDHVETYYDCVNPNEILADDGVLANFQPDGWIVVDFGEEIANVTSVWIQMNYSTSSAVFEMERSTDTITWYKVFRWGGIMDDEAVQTTRYDSEIHGRFRYLRLTCAWSVNNDFDVDFIAVVVSPPLINYDDGTYVYPDYLYYFNWGFGHSSYASRPYNVLGKNMTDRPTVSYKNETTRLVNSDYDEDNYLIVRFNDYYNITSVGIHYSDASSSSHQYMYIGDSLDNMTLIYDNVGYFSGWASVSISYTRCRYIRVSCTGSVAHYMVIESFRIEGDVHVGVGGGADTEDYAWEFYYFPNWLSDALGIPVLAGQLLASACVLACVLLPFAFYERRSFWATIIIGLVVFAFLVALGWLPTWLMLLLTLLVAGLFGKRFSDWFGGR